MVCQHRRFWRCAGAGYYSGDRRRADVINDASKMVLAALEDGPETQKLRIAGFGAADGGAAAVVGMG